MRVGSLFSGIGGLDLGLERAGMQIAWQVEIDDYCRRVLAKHWPDVPRYGDIREVDLDQLERVDLLCGGFPCQPVSRAGHRLAQADERWLWPDFARAIRHLRPRYVFVENVPGLLVHAMGDVLGDLALLGYDAEWESIPAAAVGAPHIRDRTWIVAYAVGMPGRLGDELEPVGGRSREAEQTGMGTRQMEHPGVRRCRTPGITVFPRGRSPELSDWWEVEPRVGRMADGLPRQVDRLRGLGNAVVPQVAEWVGRQIMESVA